MGLEQRLLHDAGQVDLALEAGVHLEAGQQGEVGAELLQVMRVNAHARLPM